MAQVENGKLQLTISPKQSEQEQQWVFFPKHWGEKITHKKYTATLLDVRLTLLDVRLKSSYMAHAQTAHSNRNEM